MGPSRYLRKFRRHANPGRGLGHVALPKFVHHTGCLCSAGSGGLPRYPTSSLVCSPPTPLRHRPGLWFPSPPTYPGYGRFSEPAERAPVDARRVGGGCTGSSVAPLLPVDRQGSPRLLGCPCAHVPWSSTPPGGASPCPLAVALPTAFGVYDPLGFPERMTISGLHSHGPRARLPTHQPERCRSSCKAGYRPAGLSFSRAGLAPAGQQTEFREVTA